MMEETLQHEIMEVLEKHKKQILEDTYVKRININTTPDQVIHILCKLFKKIESNIEDEHKKSFVTDTYENGIMNFATELMKIILKYHTIFLKCADYKRLLNQRHIAYAIYNLFNNRVNKSLFNEIIYSDELLYKITYMGLVDFYELYYGSFYDNEKAIVLLCSFYPQNLVLEQALEEKIVSALYKHITNAGTPSDIGYAFGGIEKIQKHIGGLPVHIVEKLLKRYELFYILNEKVKRHQIFEIIDCSKINIEDKPKIKFFFLDSLLIADRLNKELFRRKEVLPEIFVEKVKPHYNSSNQNMQEEELLLFDTPKSYWTNEVSQVRQFYVDRAFLIEIKLETNEIIVSNKNKQLVKQEFDYNDWIMDNYHSRQFENDIDELIIRVAKKRTAVQMAFSLVQLDNYRGIDNRTIDFDHRFKIDQKYKITKNIKENNQQSMQFYGKNIYTMTCIVGKNGTGKTSIIDFLRETFFKILKIIEETDIVFEAGYIDEKDYYDYELLEKNVKFFVVFRIGENDFYLTNNRKIDGLEDVQVLPYKKGAYESSNELSKIIYFSNMLSLNQNLSIENEKQVQILNKEKDKKRQIAQALSDFKQIDCSEKKSYLWKMRSIKAYRERLEENESQTWENLNNNQINKELYIQLTYLESIMREELKKNLDISDKNRFCINSELLKNDKQFNCIEDLNKAFIEGALDELLYVPDSQIGYFSSGQYAKFSFLSKLHWIVEGYQEKRDYLKKNQFITQFTADEALLKEDSALIFIDEGELYYHPEWQRRYIKTLIDLFRDHQGRIQIILTTNSPFILSDIRKEDVCYLSDSAKIKDETFGQNIHKLLKDNFFMDFTIGEYSRLLIEKIMSWLGKDEKNKENNIEDTILDELRKFYGEEIQHEDMHKMIDQLIDQVGEEVYHDTLKRMLEESNFFNKQNRIKKLNEEKERIEIEIQKLRYNTND